MVVHQLKLLWVGDRCPSRHLFETECHVFPTNAMSDMSVLSVFLSRCMYSSLFE